MRDNKIVKAVNTVNRTKSSADDKPLTSERILSESLKDVLERKDFQAAVRKDPFGIRPHSTVNCVFVS